MNNFEILSKVGCPFIFAKQLLSSAEDRIIILSRAEGDGIKLCHYIEVFYTSTGTLLLLTQ